jgi:gamma-glutamyl phosphate reductase
MDSEVIARTAKEAFVTSQLIQSSERINALKAIKQELARAKQAILAANAEDLKVGLFRTLLLHWTHKFCRPPK